MRRGRTRRPALRLVVLATVPLVVSSCTTGGATPRGADLLPVVLDTVRVPADTADGQLTTVRVRTPARLVEVVADDPPGVRTRYVSWQRCTQGCGVGGPYDAETRRLLAQALPPRYPVPAGTVGLVLAVRVDRRLDGCVEVPALLVRGPSGAQQRLTGPDGRAVVTVC